MSGDLLQCYNRGCGQKYQADKNAEDSCRHHPGEPFFHDAYKGWSCCNRKCTDFTEFLNIRGCTVSKHSNIKPIEPEKPAQSVSDVEVIEVKPIQPAMKRPPFDTPMTTMNPEIAPSVKQNISISTENKKNANSSEITVGTSCKNRGCTTTYEGPSSDNSSCTYHPGFPIFHEGLKFWSCCQRRTTDFNAFLSQIGCETGQHVWKKDDDNQKSVQCRWDFHQTGTHVFVSIYAKNYCCLSSVIKLSPVHLYANLVFPQESGATFNIDIELNGVSLEESSMYAWNESRNKNEKAEPSHWRTLEYTKGDGKTKVETLNPNDLAPKVEGVDLEDL
ncbi:cysteine and histidine-rich domain-containing protein 1 [Holotrichia oblita]|uniref:Cysteine and histidine-rich domain-containing protein 1 n=1 Tax=Holotrichia oblita TaxID=644536 RepID=A0ACB9ST37_HOLOL|nr:cysteine and histidine-rich domain-containing protein 1 [Holotrichia oblita]